MSETNTPPKSVIDKWLHFDRKFKKSDIRKTLKVEPMWYEHALAKPSDYFTITHMKKIAVFVQRDLAEVFFACYKQPIGDVIHDKEQVKIMQALDRAGIK